MPSSPSSSSDRNPVEALAEEFLDRKRRGERPTLDEYCQRHPALAEEIRDLFPVLLRMEDIGAETSNSGATTGGAAVSAQPRPERLGDFRILREVARGGMGVVYEAEQVSLGRRVALKLLPDSALADTKQVLRFEREARAAARLHHTNIVPVFGAGHDDGHHFYVMQFIPGMGLDAVLEELRRLRGKTGAASPLNGRSASLGAVSAAAVAEAILTGRDGFSLAGASEGAPRAAAPETVALTETDAADRSQSAPFDPAPSSVSIPGASDRLFFRSVARIGHQVAEALEYANRQGVLHRDIKPANLLLDPKGNVWVADFGLAKATDTRDVTEAGDLLGTVRYMAPERFEGKCDPRSDVYALGLTLYELLALRPAFEAADRQALIRQVMNEAPEPLRRSVPHLPRDLETIVAKAIARDPAARYSTAAALADDLQRFLDDKPIQARRVGAAEQAWRWARRNPVVAGSLAAAAAALLAVAGVSLLYALGQERDAAEIRHLAGERTTESLKAREQARRALLALAQSNLRNAALHYQRGQEECEKGDIGSGLLRLVASWRSALAAGDLAAGWAHAARANLAAWQRHQPAFQAMLSHAGAVRSVAFSPDGKTVITGSEDNTARLWDVATGQARGQPLRDRRELYAVAFSADGRTVLTGGKDHTARLWDAATGQPLGQPLANPSGWIVAVAFSPDGKTVLTGSEDTTAQLWDAAKGQPLGPPLTHSGQVHAVAFSPDGKTILTGSHDRTAQLWDTATGRRIGPPLMHQGPVLAVAFSPDGRTVMTGCWDSTARLWDAATGQPLPRALTHSGSINAVAFSPDGKTVLTGSDDSTARLWDVATGQPLGPPFTHQDRVSAVAFSPDGKTVMTGCWDSTARLWDAATGPPLGRPLTHPGQVTAVAFSPDAKTVITGSNDKTARLWDVATGQARGQPLTHRGGLWAVAFSPDGKTVITGSSDTTARLWDAATSRPCGPQLTHSGGVRAVAFSPDGKTVLTGDGDSMAQLWDVATGRPLGPPLTHRDLVSAVAFSPDGKTVMTGCWDRTARLWDAATGPRLGRPLTHPGQVTAVAFSPDGKTVMTGCWDRTARLWNAATGQRLGPPLTHRGVVSAVAFSPDGKSLLTGSRDHTARRWDAATGQSLGPPLTHQDEVWAVAFSPDGKTLLTGSRDHTARFWEVTTAVPDEVERVATWVEVITGLELDDEGYARALDGATWLQRRETLEELGGPPAEESTKSEVDAIVEYRAVLRRTPNFAAVHHNLGIALRAQGDLDGAIAAFRDEFRLSSASTDAPAELIETLKARNLPDQGIALFDELIRAQPQQPKYALARARYLVELGQRDLAAADLAKAALHWPNDLSGLKERGRLYALVGLFDEAAAHFGRALELVPQVESPWKTDDFTGVYPEAVSQPKIFERLVHLRPQDQTLLFARIRHHARRREWPEAAAVAARLGALEPRGYASWHQEGVLRSFIGDSEGYRRVCRGMLEQIGSTSTPVYCRVAINLCLLEPNALPDLGALAPLMDRSLGAPNALGAAYGILKVGHYDYRLGRFSAAIERLRPTTEAKDTDPGQVVETAMICIVRAMAHQKSGQADEARRWLAAAEVRAQQAPFDPQREGPLPTIWEHQLRYQVLHREAEALIRGAAAPEDKVAP